MSYNSLNSKCKSVIGRPLALSLMMLLSLTASAQSKVTGTVTSANGETVIGATVKIKGVKGVGTVTDLDGKFTINAKPGQTLEISYIGYSNKTAKVPANGKISIYTIAESEDSIFIPFKKKPAVEGNNMALTVTNPAGSASVDRFYDYSTILTTFDGDATDNGWGPNASYVDAGNADGKYAHIDVATEYQQWWGTMIYFRKDWSGNSFSFSDNIPASATADELYLTMNVYDAGDYNNGSYWGYLRYVIQPLGDAENQYDNFEWPDGGAASNPQVGKYPDGPVLQDINGKFYKKKWYRAVVPLSKFNCYAGKDFSAIKSVGLNQFRIQSINQSTTSGKLDVKFDNIRVIYIPKK